MEICKRFQISRIIYWSSKRSEQFFETKYFFDLLLEASSGLIHWNNKYMPFGTNNDVVHKNTQVQVEKDSFYNFFNVVTIRYLQSVGQKFVI